MFKLIFNLFFIILNFLFLIMETTKENYQILTLFIFIFIILCTNLKKEYNKTIIYNLFIFTNLFFVFSRIFLDLFGHGDFTVGNKWIYYEYTKEQMKEILFFINSVILFINFGFSIKTLKVKANGVKEYKLIEKIGTLLFLFSLPGLVLKLLFQLKVIIQNGYIYRYTEAFQKMYIPPYLKGWGVIFDLGFYMLVFSRPSKKKFNLLAIVYIIIQLLISQGSRGQMIIPIICIVFYNYSVYKVAFSKAKIAIGILLIIPLFMIVGNLRAGNELNVTVKDAILGSIWSQGVTLNGTIGYSVIYKDTFINDGLPYFLSPLISKKYEQDNYSEAISKLISLENFLHGEGMGGSFYGELYEVRYLEAFLLAFLLGIFLKFFEENYNNNNYFFLLFFIILPSILWMPRGNLLIDYGLIIKIGYIFLFIQGLIVIEKKLKMR